MSMLDNIGRFLGADEGTEQKVDDDDLSPEKHLEAAREGKSKLLSMAPGTLAKFVKRRWDGYDKDARRVQTQLKVNHLRFEGNQFAQVHPENENRVYTPNAVERRMPPTINRIRRAVHRYQAQVTADEPIIEGVPAAHTDEARDAAEAATSGLRGEWHRLRLNRHLQRTVQIAGVMRSGFWFFEWDKYSGGKTPAMKFFTHDETGDRELKFVDSSGEPVDEPEEAAYIWEGNLTAEVLTPFNVRWSGGNTAHEAEEVLVAKLVTLRKVYEMDPSARKAKVSQLVGQVPAEAEQWLHDIRGAGGFRSFRTAFDGDNFEAMDGTSLEDGDSLLDAPVMLIHYFRPKCKAHPKGFHAVAAGKHLMYSGKLKFGVVPVAQFRLLDDHADPLGLGLVDLLKDPQELLDFVNTQVLRWLQSLKRRWFVPMGSSVKTRDLMNPTQSVITFNPNAGAPVPEQHGELPHSLTDWVDRFDQSFDDELGIHDTMQGKHVPGVSSGRHAEALRSGDETVLGLTRTQIEEGLVHSGKIILGAMRKEWSKERKVQFFDNREYIEIALSRTDFGETNEVRLKKGTLLMLTPAQKLETLFSYAEMGLVTGRELRKLAPLTDVAGVSITEDPHYIRARRQNSKFLAGPPDELVSAREKYEEEIALLGKQMEDVQRAIGIVGGLPEPNEEASNDLRIATETIERELAEVETEWAKSLAKFSPTLEEWEAIPEIAQIHVEEHTAALAQDKAQRFPTWWTEQFSAHSMGHVQHMSPPQPGQGQQQGGAPAPGTPVEEQGGRQL